MKEIQDFGSGVKMGDVHVLNNIRYADDTTLLETEFESLQISMCPADGTWQSTKEM